MSFARFAPSRSGQETNPYWSLSPFSRMGSVPILSSAQEDAGRVGFDSGLPSRSARGVQSDKLLSFDD